MEEKQTLNVGEQEQKSEKTRKAYDKPTIQTDEAFEGVALECSLVDCGSPGSQTG